jgi:hypothetical protein
MPRSKSPNPGGGGIISQASSDGAMGNLVDLFTR